MLTTVRLAVRLGVVGVVAAALTGCVTYSAVPLRDGAFPSGAVRVGDEVRAETRTGESLSFEVAGVDNGTLTGNAGERVPAGELTQLERGRLNKRATFITLGVLGGVLGTAIVLDELEDCDSGWLCEYE